MAAILASLSAGFASLVLHYLHSITIGFIIYREKLR